MATDNCNREPALYEFLVGIKNLNASPDGQVHCEPKFVEDVIEAGEYLFENTSLMLEGMGYVHVYCTENDKDTSTDTIGWMVSYIGEIQSSVRAFLNTLKAGEPLPIITKEHCGVAEFSDLLKLIPACGHTISTLPTTYKSLACIAEGLMDVDTVNLRVYSELLLKAQISRELSEGKMTKAMLVTAEWAGFVQALDYYRAEAKWNFEQTLKAA